jgi:condensin complex subunit 2
MLAGDGSSIPFNTQFFHDEDDDGPGFDDGFDGDLADTADPGEQDLLSKTQGKTRRVRPEFIKYTKRAKRVDVRKLKENIWRGLKIPTPDEQQPANPEAMVRDIPEKNSHMRTSPPDSLSLACFGRTLRETRRRVSQIPRKRARSMK